MGAGLQPVIPEVREAPVPTLEVFTAVDQVRKASVPTLEAFTGVNQVREAPVPTLEVFTGGPPPAPRCATAISRVP